MHVFQAAPGGLGQDQGEGESKHGHPGGEQQRAAQAQRGLQYREQEDADEGAEFADAGGDPVPGGAHAERVQLAGHDEGGHVRAELGEEVAHPVHQQERHDHGGQPRHGRDDQETGAHHREPEQLQPPVPDLVQLRDREQVAGHRRGHEDGQLQGDLGHGRGGG